MDRKGLISILIIVYCFMLTVSICFAEIHAQKDKLFKIDVVDGWAWEETDKDVTIKSPKGDTGIYILFKRMRGNLLQKRVGLWTGKQGLIHIIIKPQKGKIISDKNIQLDGVYATKLDYILPEEDETMQMTYISFFNKGYAFTVVYGSTSEEEKLNMDKMIESLRLR